MAITYTQEQRATAKAECLRLVSIDADGMAFQGPVSLSERRLVAKFLAGLLYRRQRWLAERGGAGKRGA